MTGQPPGGGHFQARRDNHGAFATGPGASARNVEPGSTYIENYNGAAWSKAFLQSSLAEEHCGVVLNGRRYVFQTVDTMLIEMRRRSPEIQQEPNGTVKVYDSTRLFFRGADGHSFDRVWPNLDFPCSVHEWVTFLLIYDSDKEYIDSFCLHSRPDSWYKWTAEKHEVSIDLPDDENCFVALLFFIVGITLLVSFILLYHVELAVCLGFFAALVTRQIYKRERQKFDRAIKRARQAVRFCSLEQ